MEGGVIILTIVHHLDNPQDHRLCCLFSPWRHPELDAMRPACEIVLFGREESTPEACQQLGPRQVSYAEKDKSGVLNGGI